MGIAEALIVFVVLVLTIGPMVGIPLLVYYLRRKMDYNNKLRSYGGAWQAALRALDPSVRIQSYAMKFIAEFTWDGLPYRLEFADFVEVRALTPATLQLALPADGKIQGLAQRIETRQGCPSLR